MLKVYTYQGCSTCRAAAIWLKSHGIPFEEVPIRATPPSVAELRGLLKARGGNLRALFNTSGQEYRALGLKDSLPDMPEEEALERLSGNGNLVKRPVAADPERGIWLNGFKQAEWQAALG